IRKQIAYVDQDVMMGEGHVQKIIAEYFSFAANSKIKFTPLELTELLERFDLEPVILTKDIGQLSGGEKQRLALVVALLLKRPVMVFDEVTSSLDPASKTIVIRELLKNSKSTLLIITHDEEWQYQKNVRIFDFKEKKWKQ
ncbi:ATP-binding cassette domain-containing protein, partial [Candidatus Pacearchaeota archaeon]|nr:ATP-binding cassette domain-containing protein [Candidatus Pacearchaeota archaeon]